MNELDQFLAMLARAQIDFKPGALYDQATEVRVSAGLADDGSHDQITFTFDSAGRLVSIGVYR